MTTCDHCENPWKFCAGKEKLCRAHWWHRLWLFREGVKRMGEEDDPPITIDTIGPEEL